MEHRYDNLSSWHFEGGWTPQLEEELVLATHPHDAMKAAIASAVDIAVAPKQKRRSAAEELLSGMPATSSRFGGIAFRG